MAAKNYNENPTISDTVIFELITTDSSDEPVDPYKVNNIIIYFIERGFTAENVRKYTKSFGETVLTQYFKDAVPIQIYGNEDYPAWIVTDTDNAFITKEDFDSEGDPQTGVFRLEWVPHLAREGDYLLCYSWTPIIAGDVLTKNIQFYLNGDTKQTTSIPTHFTPADKYETLLDRYLPEMFKMTLADVDLTPDILDRLNKSVAKGFTSLEDLANQIVDLIDSNAVSDALLPYLSNLFGLRLKGDDVALWRRQIKRAIPLYKKKGTLSGLKEALSNADIKFIKFTKLWQVVSKTTWQEGFKITEAQSAQSTPIQFSLKKEAILPVDEDNYELYIRLNGQSEYSDLTLDYVTFENEDGITTMTWVGDNLSLSPISLEEGDVVKIIYKIAEPDDQSIENYIRSLSLADQRDETLIDLPYKNWNVRVIAEDDAMFDVIIPERHPFNYPLIYGKIRTEFPYSENIYNMEEYNGSTRDSKNPCDLDKSFYDNCSSCQSSKFTIDIEIEDLSADRLIEAEEIIREFVPFHAVVHSINYSGSKNEFMTAPVEEIEILIAGVQQDNVIATQMNFNRLIEDGSSDANELKRNMLASSNATAETGTGTNLAITMFSPGIRFDSIGIDSDGDNYLEILSGTDQGEYKVEVNQQYTADIIQGMPDTINWPLDTSSFPFRLSNELYSDTVSIYQDDKYVFSDESISFIEYGAMEGWKIAVTAGLYAGVYEITQVNSDNTLTLDSFPTSTSQSSLSYELRTPSNAARLSNNMGVVTVTRRGRVETDLIVTELGIRITDYVKYGSSQYKIIDMATRDDMATVDKIYIDNYTSGDVVGVANIIIYRRLVDGGVGYLQLRGMNLNGAVPTVDYTAENDLFMENYLILIGTSYYQIASIDGSDMILNGPQLAWGLTGTSVSYSIVHFTKTSPITSQDGHVFDRLDRRGNDSIEVITETEMPMFMTATMLNSVNTGQPVEFVGQKENIWFDVEYR